MTKELSLPSSEQLGRGPVRDRAPAGQLQWVVKISKFCNLRCHYCYEYTSLGDRRRMSLHQLRKMFEHIAGAYAGTGREMAFVWHGGEPLLIEPAFYEDIFSAQKDILGTAGIPFSNSVQTNLTVITDQTISLLKNGFTHVGVSLDLFGGQRVGPSGISMEERVVSNIQRLRDAGLNPGCITVLSRATVDHVAEIYRFYEAVGLSFRLLPIYRTSYFGQQDRHALSPAEVRTAFTQAIDLWFASESTIQVRPIRDYIINAVRFMNMDALAPQIYDQDRAEAVYIVDTDGSLYTNGDAYEARLSHGNIFEHSFAEMKASSGYRLSLEGCVSRMAAACGSCKFHGACSGFYMGQATPEQRTEERGKLICSIVQPLQEYIVSRLQEPVVFEAMVAKAQLDGGGLETSSPEM